MVISLSKLKKALSQKLYLSILVLCYFTTIVYSQNDSLYFTKKKKFLTDKFWQQHNYHSSEWQIYLDSALVYEPQNAYLWQQKSMPLLKRAHYSEGMKFLDKAVQCDTLRYLGYRGFMKCIFMKDYLNAIIDLQAIYKKRPLEQIMDHSYPFWIGISYLKLGKLDSAKIFIDVSINETISKRGNTWVHFNERFYNGVCYFEQKKYEESLREFDEALKLNSRFSDAQFYKAKVLLALNKRDDCLELLQNAKQNNEKGLTISEDNELYVNYPFQVKLKEINDLIYYIQN